jgi:hypothetical protein
MAAVVLRAMQGMVTRGDFDSLDVGHDDYFPRNNPGF